MEYFKELMLGNVLTVVNMPTHGFQCLLMPGTCPTTAAELKAAVDIYDIQDMWNKSIGFLSVDMLRAGSAQTDGQRVACTQVAKKTALKKGDLDYGVTLAAAEVSAGLRLASIADKIYLCAKDAPYNRLSEKTGMAGLFMTNMFPWSYYAGNYGVVTDGPYFAGQSNHPESKTVGCTEFEWDTPRNFAGIMRCSVRIQPSNYFLLYYTVEAWNSATQAWEVVLPKVTAYGSAYAAYLAFTKRIVTTKLRIIWDTTNSAGGNAFSIPFGCLPVEVAADAPAAEAVPDIGWAIMLPFFGSNGPAAAAMAKYSNPSYPVPALIAKVGGPGDSTGYELILSKRAGLVSTDKPTCTGLTIVTSNLVGA